MRARPLTLLLVVIAALAVGACGDKQEITLHGATEGTYIDVGGLKYQVQISRLLNPTDREDEGYLIDLPAGQCSHLGGRRPRSRERAGHGFAQLRHREWGRAGVRCRPARPV